jgi:hypothetical protein
MDTAVRQPRTMTALRQAIRDHGSGSEGGAVFKHIIMEGLFRFNIKIPLGFLAHVEHCLIPFLTNLRSLYDCSNIRRLPLLARFTRKAHRSHQWM